MTLYLAQFFIAYIPQMALVVLTVYILAQKTFQKDKIIITTMIMSIIALIVRRLPISFGIHTVILMFFHFIILLMYNGICIKDSIKGLLIAFLIILIAELIYVPAIVSTLGIVLDKDNIATQFYLIPTSLIHGVVNLCLYNILIKKAKIIN